MVVFAITKNEEDLKKKIKALELSQHFPQYKTIGAICRHGNQRDIPAPMMFHVKFDCTRPTSLGDLRN